ncbi:unnamed protein product [Ranitomeya imitator]|uniref:D-isomer specific 2-hydroxyacid dehydrogenase catalytic domain-containing protein n=1 Tax=Ranitomeya imitator TaxID=111125 RepID=A0ABN9LAZ2_9NEOB|nr:unnamed protein product [Ranitomeya imitator]
MAALSDGTGTSEYRPILTLLAVPASAVEIAKLWSQDGVAEPEWRRKELKACFTRQCLRMTENKELPGALVEEIGGPNGVMEEHLDFLKERFTLITLKELKENKEELAEKIVCIFNWGNKPDVDSELLRCLPRLKVVASAGAGVDHLDIKMISSFGVKVANTPHAVTNCTADLAMTLLLVAARNFMEGNRQHIPQHFTIKRGTCTDKFNTSEDNLNSDIRGPKEKQCGKTKRKGDGTAEYTIQQGLDTMAQRWDMELPFPPLASDTPEFCGKIQESYNVGNLD